MDQEEDQGVQGVLMGRLGVQAAPRAVPVDSVGEHHTLEAQVDSVGAHHILEAIHAPKRFANLEVVDHIHVAALALADALAAAAVDAMAVDPSASS